MGKVMRMAGHVEIRAVIFDWGDTLMRDLQYPGAMVHWPRVELVPGAVEALEAIEGQYICCLASNAGDSDAALMAQALDRAGIRRYFDHLWTSRELGANKPDTRFFQAVLQNLRLAPTECVFVGNDYQKDIVPAKASGMRTVWLAPPALADDSAADRTIARLEELPGTIDALNPSQNKWMRYNTEAED
jgi:putative hydrolase of the HAD superfamily